MLKFSARGFTFVELLVVISILAILSAVAITAYSGNLRRARDAKRQTDLRLIQSALEKYRADQGYYPLYIGIPGGAGPYVFGSIGSSYNGSLTNATGVPAPAPLVTKVYLSTYPYDPDPQKAYIYKALKSVGSGCDSLAITQCVRYCLYAILENVSGEKLNGCPNNIYTGSNFTVTSPD